MSGPGLGGRSCSATPREVVIRSVGSEVIALRKSTSQGSYPRTVRPWGGARAQFTKAEDPASY